jgi:hypothetical protein
VARANRHVLVCSHSQVEKARMHTKGQTANIANQNRIERSETNKIDHTINCPSMFNDNKTQFDWVQSLVQSFIELQSVILGLLYDK